MTKESRARRARASVPRPAQTGTARPSEYAGPPPDLRDISGLSAKDRLFSIASPSRRAKGLWGRLYPILAVLAVLVLVCTIVAPFVRR